VGQPTINQPPCINITWFASTAKIMKYLSTNIKYPNKARKKGIEGVVYIKFIVNRRICPFCIIKSNIICKQNGITTINII
jgi:hypothetical protein